MVARYPATYQDAYGQEKISIENDGRLLRTTLRGVAFVGRDFYFELAEDYDESQLEGFNLFLNELCSYSLDCEVPIWVTNAQDTHQETLHVHTEYGAPVEGFGGTTIRRQDGTVLQDTRQIIHEVLQLAIMIDGQVYKTKGESRYNSFDEQLTELAALVPGDTHLKICWTCAFSDYHPAGSGQFGHLACFRNTKERYLQARTKQELLTLWDRRAEYVQEVSLCPEYKRRQPGSGLYIGEEYPGKRN